MDAAKTAAVTRSIVPRPTPLTVDVDALPRELKGRKIWVLWKYTWKEDKSKWDKPPLQPDGSYANATDSVTWSTFEEVKNAYENGQSLPVDDSAYFDGIGVASGEPYTIIDLDGCVIDGQITEEARADLVLLNSYSELSPSATGVRIVVEGKLPGDKLGRRKGSVEAYSGAHYLTLTGRRLTDYPATIEKRQKKLDIFYEKHFGVEQLEQPDETPLQAGSPSWVEVQSTDEDIIQIASKAKNAAKFKRLMGGDTSGYKSNSEADQALCNILAFYTKDEAQIDRIFRTSGLYRDKWDRKDYRERTIRAALNLATENYEPHPELNTALDTAELVERVKEDPRALKDPKILETLAALRNDDPIEFDLIVGEITKAYPSLKRKTIEGEIGRLEKSHETPDSEETPQDMEKAPPEITAKAMEILENGDPIKFLLDTIGRMHIGDRNLIEIMLLCLGVQSVINSKGMHPGLSGESGMGKSDAVYATLFVMHPSIYIRAGMSPKALFHHNIKRKAIIFMDDYRQDPDIDSIIKQTSSFFHEPYEHLTVIEHEGRILKAPSEIVWIITSVSGSSNLQVLNRQVNEDVDDSVSQTKKVIDAGFAEDTEGLPQYVVTEDVLICREITRIIHETDVKVIVPFANRIEWADLTNRRNPSIFRDMLKAYAMFRFKQRSYDPETGVITATEEDFEAAKRLYGKRAGAMKDKLTRVERKLAMAIMENGNELYVTDAAKILGISRQRVTELALGEDHKGGLSQKLSGFSYENISVEEVVKNEKRRVSKAVMRLEGQTGLDIFDESIVKLKPLSTDLCKDCKGQSKGLCKGDDPYQEPQCKDCKGDLENTEDKKLEDTSLVSSNSVNQSTDNSGLARNEKDPCSPCIQPTDNGHTPCTVPCTTLAEPCSESIDSSYTHVNQIDAELVQAAKRMHEKEEHFKTPSGKRDEALPAKDDGLTPQERDKVDRVLRECYQKYPHDVDGKKCVYASDITSRTGLSGMKIDPHMDKIGWVKAKGDGRTVYFPPISLEADKPEHIGSNDADQMPQAKNEEAEATDPVDSGQQQPETGEIEIHDAIKGEYFNGDNIYSIALIEYAQNGWIDPVKIANHLKIDVKDVTGCLDYFFYRYERQGGGVGYEPISASSEQQEMTPEMEKEIMEIFAYEIKHEPVVVNGRSGINFESLYQASPQRPTASQISVYLLTHGWIPANDGQVYLAPEEFVKAVEADETI